MDQCIIMNLRVGLHVNTNDLNGNDTDKSQ